MGNILNSVTGREKYLIDGNNVYSAITGAVIGIIENGVVKNPTTGNALALVVSGEGGSIDLSFITAGASDILNGKVGSDSAGNPVYGTITQKAAASYTPGTSDQSIAAGVYLAGKQTIKGDSDLTAGNIRSGKNIFGKAGTFTADATATAADILKGKTAGIKGAMVTGELEVSAGGSIDFYECTSYTPGFAGGFQYSMTVSGASDPKANGTYIRKVWVAEPSYDWSDDPIAVWENANGYTLKEYYYSEFNYTIYNASGNSVYYPNEPYWERVTDYNNIMWTDTDWNDVTLTFVDEAPVELPPVTEAWSGQKVVQDTETGLWSRTDTVKEGMTAPFFTPQVGMVYSEDTSIACAAIFNEAAGHLEALYHFDNDTIDATGKTKITSIGEGWYKSNSDAKFGNGSIEADCYMHESGYSSYYLDISGLPEMDAFTIEWWQKDDSKYGDGGYILSQPETDNLPVSVLPAYRIPHDSSDYAIHVYRHWAFVRKAKSSTVDVYLNGKKMGSVEFTAKLGGRLVKFTGVSSYSGTQVKNARIDELAIYSVAKYTGDFTPANSPIVI